jgi:chaperonin GroEL
MGPCARYVAIDSSHGKRAPELLDNGGLIARRMLELPDHDENMGAMLLRDVLWRVYEHEADGTATTCVLFESVFEQGLRYLASGGNPVQFRRHLHAGLEVILDELQQMTMHVHNESQLIKVAEAACPDVVLARALGELFSVIGEYGHVEMRASKDQDLGWDYIEGAYWETPILSPLMLAHEANRQLELQQCLVLCSNLEIENPHDLIPLLEMAKREDYQGLVLIANRLSDSCIAMMLKNSDLSAFRAIAVRSPEVAPADQMAALDDLERLTGGRALRMAAGDTLRQVRFDDLGRARRIWVDRQYLGIIGGKGDPRVLRSHVRDLQAQHHHSEDHQTRLRLSRRIGRLLGASAVLWINGATVPVIDARKELAARVCTILRGALSTGVVPGGGAALLACQPRLESLLALTTNADERAAYRILLRALEEPTRTIAMNAGSDPSSVLARRGRAGLEHGWDHRSDGPADVEHFDILDSASVLRTAVSSAIRGASQALTIDVLVHQRKPDESMMP